MFWRKLNYLVPEPDCDTQEGAIVVWRDVRPRPSRTDILAVDMALVEAKEQGDKDNRFELDDIVRKIATALFQHENRIRVLEGKTPVTKKQFIRVLKAL